MPSCADPLSQSRRAIRLRPSCLPLLALARLARPLSTLPHPAPSLQLLAHCSAPPCSAPPFAANIELNAKAVDFSRVDLRYLLREEYNARFQVWLREATVVGSIEQARQRAASGSGGTSDLKVWYGDSKEFVRICKSLGLMEDLKAGIPRTAYRGVVLVRIGGRRVFLAPSYAVDQEIVNAK